MTYTNKLNTLKIRNGVHTIRTKVTEASGRATYSQIVTIVLQNPEIDIYSQNGDTWDVTRRKNDSGKYNKLEVDKSVTVRINGVMR